MAFLDLFDQIQVTEFVRREYAQIARNPGGGLNTTTEFGPQILPMRAHNGRHVRMRFQEILPTGLAQMKAPGAQPALWTHKPMLREKFVELLDIDEMHRIDPIEMLELQSPDPNVLREAQWSLADRGAAMAERNDLRTEWLRWEALKGTIVVPYPDAPSITITIGIPGANFVNFTTAWTDLVNSDPIEDLWALGAAAIPASGLYLSRHHMSFATHRQMIRATKVKTQLSSYGRDVMMPTDRDIAELLREGSEIVKTDAGYLPENSTSKVLTKWIPDGKIFTTTPNYRYLNRPIGTMKDGWVLVGLPGQEKPVARQGMQSEWIYNRLGQQTLFRQASARMPVIEAPEVLAWGTAYTP